VNSRTCVGGMGRAGEQHMRPQRVAAARVMPAPRSVPPGVRLRTPRLPRPPPHPPTHIPAAAVPPPQRQHRSSSTRLAELLVCRESLLQHVLDCLYVVISRPFHFLHVGRIGHAEAGASERVEQRGRGRPKARDLRHSIQLGERLQPTALDGHTRADQPKLREVLAKCGNLAAVPPAASGVGGGRVGQGAGQGGGVPRSKQARGTTRLVGGHGARRGAPKGPRAGSPGLRGWRTRRGDPGP
jgi:hypothetical protein